LGEYLTAKGYSRVQISSGATPPSTLRNGCGSKKMATRKLEDFLLILYVSISKPLQSLKTTKSYRKYKKFTLHTPRYPFNLKFCSPDWPFNFYNQRERAKKKRYESAKCMYELPPFDPHFDPKIHNKYLAR
jgi:hypothetical protein